MPAKKEIEAVVDDQAVAVPEPEPEATTDDTAEPSVSEVKPIPRTLNASDIVKVYNGFNGKLVYRSKQTNEPFVWQDFEDDVEMELAELKRAKSYRKKYFENNWFMFKDPAIIDYLGVAQYYKYALKIGEFDSLFEKDPDEIRATISRISEGQKKSVAYRARQLISDGKIDSNRVISTLEECLGVELIERS